MTTRHGDLMRRLRDTPHVHFRWYIGDDPLAVGAQQAQTEENDIQLRLVKAVALVETAPTGADLVIDINDDGTTVFGGTKLVVAAGATRGEQTTFANTDQIVAADSLVTVDIDQVGSTEPGEFLTVHLYAEPIQARG